MNHSKRKKRFQCWLLLCFLLPAAAWSQEKPPPEPTKEYYEMQEAKLKAEEALKKEYNERQEAKMKAEEARRLAEEAKWLEEQNTKSTENHTKGFAMTKIPVFELYALGMTDTEYENGLLFSEGIFVTPSIKYPVKYTAAFQNKKLFSLQLTIDNVKQASDFSDIPAYYMQKYGEPDTKNSRDSVLQIASENETVATKIFPVKQTTMIWQFKYYSISLHLIVTDLLQGMKKGDALIKYSGNEAFANLLKE
jgi:hypothetical protein